ncbi:heterokaryon incompatibility protein (HET) domain-containing protein [Trichoderma breve]|uniref:Heterokaryon incompatibility protein (HET) domain-containing protein n=1 Tax=Trichoderma breve TaxID=2034170 RepID=A0A9W9EFB4_9HYPO|nr:heterokaryon incompatibility protein (HET) domain-containing protein [Trichoderma breve]KAJ4865629.1 heterokaryon incompatibility protein (HET) domain-containing protein [Trichoderma breve]
MARSVYEDLPLTSPRSIRILKLDAVSAPTYPGQEVEIQLSLRVVNLDDNPCYNALSYTWGAPSREAAARGMDSTPMCRVNCNGESILVTQNLFDCLQQLTHGSRSNDMEFWIDAICIHQGSEEQNRQVNLMADIYRQAKKVTIWLGKADEHTDPACVFIEKFARSHRTSGTDHQAMVDELKQHAQLSALASFFNRTWFTRVWVVQEVVLSQAATVICGSCVFSWDDITEVSHYLATTVSKQEFHAAGLDLQELPYKNPAKMAAVRRDLVKLAVVGKHLERDRDSTILLHSLIRFRNWDSFRGHDKVYALLGIHKAALGLEDAEPDSPLYPRYEQDMCKAYIGIAKYILENTSDLLLLAHVEGEDFQSIPSLPSWVPDWSVKGTLGLGITGYERFCAAAGTEAYVKPKISNDLLTLRAAKLDTVSKIGETKEEVDRGTPFVQWLDILNETEELYHNTKEQRQDVFWRCLITNTDKNGKFPSSDLREEFSSWIRGRTETRDSEWIEGARNFHSSYSHSLHLRLFSTAEGLMGVGSQSMKAGDSVWIVPGSRVPLLLRPSPYNEGRWKLVGGAYVHGFMQGEASGRGLSFETICIE